ncbi:MAG: SIR2 family protein [Pyrinomonadaceae bacterium]
MSGEFREQDWDLLIRRIKDGKCAPFLGAGAAYGVLPLGGDIAKAWAKEYGYPLEDASNLISVSQYLAVKTDPIFPKEQIVEMFKKSPSPDLNDPLEPHNVLGGLPLPVYLTTNYDDFMTKALARRKRDPNRILSRWNQWVKDYVSDNPTPFDKDPQYKPTVANPVVFHLHGYVPLAESLVLTEDDYMDFLLDMASDQEIIPTQIRRTFTGSTLLFLGYRIADWNFRVLMKSFKGYMQRYTHFAVMRVPAASEATKDEAQKYLTEYYADIDVRVYWGEVKDFMAQLKERWDKSGDGGWPL